MKSCVIDRFNVRLAESRDGVSRCPALSRLTDIRDMPLQKFKEAIDTLLVNIVNCFIVLQIDKVSSFGVLVLLITVRYIKHITVYMKKYFF